MRVFMSLFLSRDLPQTELNIGHENLNISLPLYHLITVLHMFLNEREAQYDVFGANLYVFQRMVQNLSPRRDTRRTV